MKKLLYSSLIAITPFLTQAQLTSSEKKLIDYVNAHLDPALQLLTNSVNINSGTLNVEGVKKVGALYAAQLEKLGFTIEWVNEPDSLHRAGHLVATHTGKKGKKLFLIGHLDTVFEPDMPAGPYTKLNDSTATGQGVNDMKGGDVVIITALQALEATGMLKDMNVIAYFTGDEERSGSPHYLARQDFIARAKTCDFALGFESAGGLDHVVAARRGASSWFLDITAATGHSAMILTDKYGDGAIYEAARILNTFREQLGSEQYLTFNPGLIIGGSEINVDPQDAHGSASGKSNIISPATKVSGDLRFLREPQKDSAREKMRAIVAGNLPAPMRRSASPTACPPWSLPPATSASSPPSTRPPAIWAWVPWPWTTPPSAAPAISPISPIISTVWTASAPPAPEPTAPAKPSILRNFHFSSNVPLSLCPGSAAKRPHPHLLRHPATPAAQTHSRYRYWRRNAC